MIYMHKVSLCSLLMFPVLLLLEEEKEAKFWLRKYIKWSHKSMQRFQLLFLILHHFSHHFLLMKKQGFQQDFCYLLWLFKLVIISCWGSKPGEMIVPAIPLVGGWETGTLFSLKSSPFRFWQWKSSNIFHPSFCFLCSARGIENKPKKARQSICSLWPRCLCLGGTKAGTRVCVCEDGGYRWICEGLCRDAGCTSKGNRRLHVLLL